MESSIASTAVLLVDDDESLRDLASRALERSHPHLDVTGLVSPGAALEHLDTESVDCVVTDYAMPGMDGMEFLSAIRRTEPDLPVVFFTGKGNEEVASEAIAAGVTDYIRKEPGMEVFDVLGARIENLVRIRRAEHRAAAADRRVRELFDRVSDAVLGLDDSWRVTFLNGGARSLFGPTEELEGEHLVETFPSLRDSAFESLVESALESQQSQSQEFDLPVGDYSVSVTAYPSPDGVSVFLQDLTPLKERDHEIAELSLELEESESKFRVLKSKFSRPVPPNR